MSIREQRLKKPLILSIIPHITKPGGITRKDNYKLIEYFEEERTELYDLENDLEEKIDLSERLPDISAYLLKELKEWRKIQSANMPTPNPAWDSAIVYKR